MKLTEILRWLQENHETANAISAVASAAMAAFTVLVSLVSIWFSRSALKHQQEHNRLSVRPLVYIVFGDYEDHLFVKVRNNGTGPMIIKSIRVIGADDPSKPLYEAMPELHPDVTWSNFVEDCAGRSIPVGGEIVLIDLSSEGSSSESQFILARHKVRTRLGELEIRVEYADIYNATLPTFSRSLKFFHRTLSDK